MQEQPELLIIDDQECILRLVRSMLEDSDFKVVTTSSPTEALEIIRENTAIFMILSDQRMPEMQGTELLRKAMHYRPNAMRVLTSGAMDEVDAHELVRDGACEYFIAKPWIKSHLIDVVTSGLNLYYKLSKQQHFHREQI